MQTRTVIIEALNIAGEKTEIEVWKCTPVDFVDHLVTKAVAAGMAHARSEIIIRVLAPSPEQML